MTNALAVDGLEVRYGARRVVQGLGFSVAPGERVAVLGRSGAGKTSLLRAIAGLLAPSAGRVLLQDQLASEAGRVLVPPERRGVGLVFQGLALWDHLRVEQTLTFAGRGTRAERREKARALATRVGLGDRLRARPDQLSGGERQRLALARSLASEPRLLLLDEPFAHLDAPLRSSLSQDLLGLAGELGITLILVSHQAADVLDLAQRVIVLADGALVEDAPLAEATRQPRHRETCALLGLDNVLEGELREGHLETALGSFAVEGKACPGARAAHLPAHTVRIEAAADGDAQGTARGWAVPAGPHGEQPLTVSLDAGSSLRGYAASPLPAGARVKLVVQGPLRLLEG